MVLAPELAAILIMEDLNVSAERAREILEESSELGELLNGDEMTGASIDGGQAAFDEEEDDFSKQKPFRAVLDMTQSP